MKGHIHDHDSTTEEERALDEQCRLVVPAPAATSGRGTNSGMTMAIIPSGDCRWIRSMCSKSGPNTERYGEESTTSGTP